MTNDDNKVNVLIKAWETYQNLSKGFGENSWKIRTVCIGFWSAIIAYGYQNGDKKVYIFSLLIIIMFLILDIGIKQLQDKYIERSIEIEKTINDYLVGDEMLLPNNGISTNVSDPKLRDFVMLFRLKRWRFWYPYLILVIASLTIYSI